MPTISESDKLLLFTYMPQALLLRDNGDRYLVSLAQETNLDSDTPAFTCLTKKGTDNLERLHEWLLFDETIILFGWRNGEAGSENKHEMPPPIDIELYFGDLLILRVNGNGILDDFSEPLYESFLTHMMGGFSDLDDSDGEEEEEDPPLEDNDYEPENTPSDDEDDDEDGEEDTSGGSIEDELSEEPIDRDWDVWGGRKEVAASASDQDLSDDSDPAPTRGSEPARRID